MDMVELLRLIVLLTSTGLLASPRNWHSTSSGAGSWFQSSPTNASQLAASSTTDGTFSNHFLTITILPGWTARTENQILDITHGKYILSINAMFTHASGVTGGRFPEITARMPSVNAVMRNVDQPAGGWECAQSEIMNVSSTIAGSNYYTDKSKSLNLCSFPQDAQPAWFGSFFGDRSVKTEHNITLSYDTADVNKLPKKNSQELRVIFRDVSAMLKTLRLKLPVVITKVDPDAAPPGAMVTVYGSGFRIPNYPAILMFPEFQNNDMPEPTIAPDGNSLTFLVPNSIGTISCQPGYIDVNENCFPTPADHVDINDCPQSAEFCGVPTPPGSYHIMINLDTSGVVSNSVDFTVAASAPTPVSILLLYPNQLVSLGDVITVRGNGFAPTGNTVEIGSAVVSNLSSVDGKTITFQAPAPAGESFIRGIRIYRLTVSNPNGKSNSISFGYR